MKKLLLIYLLVAGLSQQTFAQFLLLSTDTVNLGVVFENQADSAVVYLKNNSLSWSYATIEDQRAFPFYGDTVVEAHYPNQIFYQGDSLPIWIVAKPIHNMVHKGSILLRCAGLPQEVIIPYKFQGRYSNSYYAATENKTEGDLRSALSSILAAGYNSLSYNVARDNMYATLDNVGGQVTCVYTGRVATFNTRAGANSNNFNCEHTFPQGFFSENLPMKSDIHHLFSTDVAANSERGNLPFGVVSNPTWQVGGSKKNSTTFEPRDAQKGATARAMMYFVLRYQDYSNFFAGQESILRLWHQQYAPTTAEKARNNGIYQLQNNRNPFVDYPQFDARITNMVGPTAAPSQPAIYVVDTVTLPYDSAISAAYTYRLFVVNYGNTSVNLSNFQFSTPNLSFANATGSNTTLASRHATAVDVSFYPGMNYQNESLTFSANLAGPITQTVYFNKGPFPVFSIPDWERDLEIEITQYEISWQVQNNQGVVYLLDMQGRILQMQDIKSGSMDIVSLNSGLYVVSVQTAHGHISQKFVKLP